MGATLLGCLSQLDKDNGLPWRYSSKQDFYTPIIALTFPRASIVQWSCVSWPWFIVFVGVTKFQYCIALLKITCQSSVSKILVLKYLNFSFGYLIVEKYFQFPRFIHWSLVLRGPVCAGPFDSSTMLCAMMALTKWCRTFLGPFKRHCHETTII